MGADEGAAESQATRPGAAPEPTLTVDRSPDVAHADALEAGPADLALDPPDLGVPVDDRYRRVRELARGGGGRVVVAVDRKLGRTVAVKEPLATDRNGARLLREAMILARLEHPSIVPIHDAGRAPDGAPFYAMRLVGGDTLRARIDAASSLAERIALLPAVLAMTEAIAYAHSRGVIHRDLKPSNVLVGPFGETIVIDWGLGKLLGTRDLSQDGDVRGTPGGGELAMGSLERTETQGPVGTPAYMAPEQARGETVDERTDVYALGAILYHVVAGEAPYRGDGAVSTLTRVLEAPPAPLEERAPEAPRDLDAIVAKAMARDPDARYPSAGELAEDLRRYLTGRLVAAHRYSAPARAWRAVRRHQAGVSVALAALGLTAGALVAWRAAARPTTACRDAGAPVDAVWNPDVAVRLRARFLASGRPYAATVWSSVAQSIDQRAASWSAMRRQACEAARDRGEQSAQLLDARMACLDRRLGELRATIDVLADADATAVDKGPRAVAGLPALDECADAEGLLAPAPLPADPQLRRAIGEVWSRVAAARALGRTGKVAEGRKRADAALAEARALAFGPLLADALQAAGAAHGADADFAGAETLLREAIAVADAARADQTRAWAAVEEVFWVGVKEARYAEARSLAELADAMVTRAGNDDARVTLLMYRGIIAADLGKFQEGIELTRRAIDLFEKHHPAGDPRLPGLLSAAGRAYAQAGDLATARGLLERSYALYEKSHGADHPDAVGVLVSLGNILQTEQRDEEAVALYRRAVVSFEGTLGPDHPNVATARTNLGFSLGRLGRLDEAQRELQLAVSAKEKALGPDHPELAGSLYNLCVVERAAGKFEGSLAHCRRAQALFSRALGAEHPSTASARGNVGTALLSLGRPREALPELIGALATLQAGEGGGDPESLAWTRKEVGDCYLALGEPARALEFLEAARPFYVPLEAGELAPVDFAIARALWDSGGDRTRARTLAAAAVAGYDAAAAKMPPDPMRDAERAAAAAWVAKHR